MDIQVKRKEKHVSVEFTFEMPQQCLSCPFFCDGWSRSCEDYCEIANGNDIIHDSKKIADFCPLMKA